LEELKEILFFFGYDKNVNDPNNLTALFDYSKETHDALDSTHYGFRE
jgi:hypothetical protein